MGQSGKVGSAITKLDWIRSTVVARSNANRGRERGEPGPSVVRDSRCGVLPSSCCTACNTSSTIGFATFSLSRSS